MLSLYLKLFEFSLGTDFKVLFETPSFGRFEGDSPPETIANHALVLILVGVGRNVNDIDELALSFSVLSLLQLGSHQLIHHGSNRLATLAPTSPKIENHHLGSVELCL